MQFSTINKNSGVTTEIIRCSYTFETDLSLNHFKFFSLTLHFTVDTPVDCKRMLT